MCVASVAVSFDIFYIRTPIIMSKIKFQHWNDLAFSATSMGDWTGHRRFVAPLPTHQCSASYFLCHLSWHLASGKKPRGTRHDWENQIENGIHEMPSNLCSRWSLAKFDIFVPFALGMGSVRAACACALKRAQGRFGVGLARDEGKIIFQLFLFVSCEKLFRTSKKSWAAQLLRFWAPASFASSAVVVVSCHSLLDARGFSLHFISYADEYRKDAQNKTRHTLHTTVTHSQKGTYVVHYIAAPSNVNENHI